MHLSLNWLRQYVSIPNDLSAQHIADSLSLHSAEIEDVQRIDTHLKNVVVGKLTEVKPHPEKEQLHIGTMLTDTGSHQVIFGSVHVLEVGDVLPLALPGAVLPGGTIEERTIAGVSSAGMIADDKELGITQSTTGLTRFPPTTPLGTPVSDILELDDDILELDNKSVTHRPDLWGHYGFARELSAIFGTELLPYLSESSHAYLGIIAGKILTVTKHPNADRLNIVSVDVGTDNLSIVCGARNLKPGVIVPVATVGTTMPNGTEIARTEIRGVESNGMLCSPSELDLGIGKGVLLELAETTSLGTPLRQALNNRHAIDQQSSMKVVVEDTEGCPRFDCVVVDNVSITDSPQWLKARLQAAGVRPINTIVDITNYVMLELGQPMHAYDKALLTSDTFTIKQASAGQKITTLDDIDRELPDTASVVCSGSTPIGIGGIMGGQNTEIRDTTTTVVFEAASWDAVRIRKTMSSLNLRTEAGARYEKDLAPQFTHLALAKALKLVFEICPNAQQVSEVSSSTAPTEHTPQRISVSMHAPSRLTGATIPPQAMEDILLRLGFDCETSDKDMLHVSRPWWRSERDISIPEDIIEEVARIYGYQQIKPTMPTIVMQPPLVDQTIRKTLRSIRAHLTQHGRYNEVMNYSFTGTKIFNALSLSESEFLKLRNPITEYHTHMRTGLLGGLLEDTAENSKEYDRFRLFEIGRVFLPEQGEVPAVPDGSTTLPQQPYHVSGVIAGHDNGFFAVKGTIESLCAHLGLPTPQCTAPDHPVHWAHPAKQAEITINGVSVGGIGEIHPLVLDRFDIEKQVAFFDISIADILQYIDQKTSVSFTPLPKFPSVTRDLSLITDERTSVQDIERIMKQAGVDLDSVSIFDIFRGEKIGEDKKSVSYHLSFRNDERTLTDDEVNTQQNSIISALRNNNIEVRS